MATRVRRPGQPGPVGKGPRNQRSIRFPVDVDGVITAKSEAAGYDSLNDFVVDLVARALAAGLADGLAPAPPLQDRLPLSA
jgi:hypothetical protein